MGQELSDDLQRLIDAAGYRYRVVNMGVSGDTTTDGVERLPSVLALHPAVVILEFGANDGLRGQPVDSVRRNLAAMIEALQKSGAEDCAGGHDAAAQLRAGIYSLVRADVCGSREAIQAGADSFSSGRCGRAS